MSDLRTRIESSVRDSVCHLLDSQLYRRYQGAQTERLEQSLQALMDGASVVLTNSGTIALELALLSIGVEPGDEVLISGYDYPGNFWVIERLGCVPVLVDVQPGSTRIDFASLDAGYSSKTKACVFSHLHGQLQNMATARAWADDHRVTLIEDACQSIGAEYGGRRVGTFGQVAILSFGGSKVLSAGRGGALVTSDPRLHQKAKIASGTGSGAYAMSELSAAVVNGQLPYLGQINQQCCQFFAAMNDHLTAIESVKFLGGETSFANALYQAGWLLDNSSHVERAVTHLQSLGITVGRGFPGFHRRSSRRCRTVHPLVNTPNLVEQLLVIHHSAALSDQHTPQQIAAEIGKILTQ